MDNESERSMSPHEAYKEFQKDVNESNAEKNGTNENEFMDSDTDEMIEDVVDELADLGEEVEK